MMKSFTQWELNDVQRQAVELSDKPILVFAGAGSGKTRVLTRKIVYLIKEKGIKPENILAVTFTNKAAKEMKARVLKLLGVKSLKLNIGTFHSICAKILREEIHSLGFSSNFAIYDVDDQTTLIKSIIRKLEISKDISASAIRNRISALKNRMETVNKLSKNCLTPLDNAVVKIFPIYNKSLKLNNALDFDDLLQLPIKLFKKDKEILRKYQERFQYVLVDEFQDTNKPQFLFVKMLSAKHHQIFAVGDDDQSIYSWRGADISNILEFKSAFPSCEIFKLEQNYRSTQTILSAASAVVRNNNYRSPKKLWTKSQDGEMLGLMETFDEQEESEGILELLEKEILQKKRKFKDFVILYRTNAQSRALEDALRRRSIAYHIVGGLKFYERKEVKDLLAYLQLIVNPLDTVSLKRVINFPARGIGIKTIDRCEEYAAKKKIPLLEALKNPDDMEFKGKQATGLIEFYQIIKKYQELKDKFNASELVGILVDELGLIRFYKDQATAEATDRLRNIEELQNSIHDFCKRNRGAGLREFLEEVSLITDIDTWADKTNRVTLMTLHAAKGLEFPVVFIAGLEEGLFPISQSLDDALRLEEERRLFYVGITRAKEKVYLHYASNRRRFTGASDFGRVSRFIREIPEELLERITFHSAIITRTVRDKRSDSFILKQVRTVTAFNDFERGDKVEHKLFGKGMILGTDGAGEHQKISVIFQGNVRKKLIAKYANLKKL